MVAALPDAAAPADQMLRDLGTLNDLPALADGSVPLSTWLANAAYLAAPRVEAAVFAEARARLPGARPASPDGEAGRPRPSLAPPRVYIHRTAEERTALDNLARAGKPVVIWAPSRYGKAYLLKYLLRCVREADGDRSRIVEIDLALHLPDPPSLDALLENLAAFLVDRLGGDDAWIDTIARKRLPWPVKLAALLEDRLLPVVPKRLVLAIRNADAVWGTSFQKRFFQMLRSFCENTQGPWPRFRLVLLLSSMPSLVFEDSPLTNLAQEIELGDFTVEQTEALAQANGLTWDRRVIEGSLRPLVGGHPNLLCVLIDRAQRDDTPLEALLADRDCIEDIFAGPLADIGKLLDQDAQLRDALRRLLADPMVPVRDDLALRLRHAGLVDRAGGGYRIRNQLYATYLRRRWATTAPV